MDNRRKPREPAPSSAGILDTTIAVAVIGVLLSVCIVEHRHIVRQVYAVEAISQTKNFRIASQLHLAQSGEWPDSERLNMASESSTSTFAPELTELVRLDPGSAVFRFRGEAAPEQDHRFTVNAAMNHEGGWGSVVWICGNAEPPRGFQRISGNATTMSPRDLPLSCRS